MYTAAHCFLPVIEGRNLKIETVEAVLDYLSSKAAFTFADFEKKKGTGIWRRRFHLVPLRAISRRLPVVNAMPGSKSKHQFLDMGTPGKLLWRMRPCHVCDGCMECDPQKILTECKHNDICGKAEEINITVSGQAAAVLTRSKARALGKQMSNEAVVGDFLVVEMAVGDELPWVIGEVVTPVEQYDGEDVEGTFGEIKQGDSVIELRQWTPLENGGGSATFTWSDNTDLVKHDDVRFRITKASADVTKFKVSSNVVPSCNKHHKLVKGPFEAGHECDLCDCAGTTWRCTRRLCDYDLCAKCKELKSARRRLLPATKLEIYAAMPNLDADPFEDVEWAETWDKEYKTLRPGEVIKDIARSLQISVASLLAMNQGQGFEPNSRLRKGTGLWVPGPSEAPSV